MKLFADTANLQEIEDLIEKGIICGVTTNPSLMAKEPKTDFFKHIKKIADVCRENEGLPLSVEVFATTPDEMIRQAQDICEQVQYGFLNIKIPIGYEELKVINNLVSQGISVNCTCCFTASQLELAALAGARYVSLFYNRLIDAKGDPTHVLKQTRKFIDDNRLDCEIICGSIRKPSDVSDAWAAGSHIVTAGHKVIKDMTKHYKTDESINGFLSDFEAWIK
jgi:transaldolase